MPTSVTYNSKQLKYSTCPCYHVSLNKGQVVVSGGLQLPEKSRLLCRGSAGVRASFKRRTTSSS